MEAVCSEMNRTGIYLKWDVLDPMKQQWLSSHYECWEPKSCSFWWAGCLSSLSLALKVWRILREPLVSHPRWKTEEARFWCQKMNVAALAAATAMAEECTCTSKGTDDELSSKTWRQRPKKQKNHFSFYMDRHQKIPCTFWVNLLISNNPTKKMSHRCVYQPVCLLSPDPIKLIPKMNHHRSTLCQPYNQSYFLMLCLFNFHSENNNNLIIQSKMT